MPENKFRQIINKLKKIDLTYSVKMREIVLTNALFRWFLGSLKDFN